MGRHLWTVLVLRLPSPVDSVQQPRHCQPALSTACLTSVTHLGAKT